jgi:hypothetical protein
VWLASAVTALAAFVVLPAPARLRPDEPMPREETDRGRARFAAILGVGTTLVLLFAHLLVPTVVATITRYGEMADDRTGIYETGPFRNTSGPSTEKFTRPDGTLVERKYYFVNVVAPVAEGQFRDAPRGVHEFATLTLPLLFVAAIATRRRVWRWSGALFAGATAVAAATCVDLPWSYSSYGMHPLQLVWWGTPPAFLAAFLLLPPARAPRGADVSAER